MNPSIKRNYIYNLINTFSSFFFQLASFPYVSRVLLPDGVGHVDFYQSIIQYVTLLSSLGIPLYAIREVARVRDDEILRNRTVLEILTLHLALTFLGYLGIFVLSVSDARIIHDLPLFIILSFSLFFTTIGCEWFYKGIEDFKYITIRGVVIRGLSLILLFVFVREQSDLYYYAILLVLGTVGNNILNFFRLKNYIQIRQELFADFHPFRHIKHVLRIFALNLITSIYVQLNTVMLGFMSEDTAVGLFSSASRISHFLLTFGSALGSAMLPRMSNLINENKIMQFNSLANKSMAYMVAISLPLSIGLALTAPILIVIFCGESFYAASTTLQILSPIVIMISMSNVIGIQILYPLGKEKLVILSTGIGALVNLLLNLVLIPLYSHNGAAIATTIAEISVVLCMLIIGKKYLSIHFFCRSYGCYLAGGLLMSVILLFSMHFFRSNILSFIVAVGLGAGTYCMVLLLLKEPLVTEFVQIMKLKFK